MLPTKPQFISKVVLGGIKAYKENIVLILPVSIILSALFVVSHVLLKIDQPWATLARLPLFLLIMFCFYGGINFVYDLLSKQKTDYKISLEIGFKRFLKAIVLPVVLFILFIMFVLLLFSAGVINRAMDNKLFLLIYSIMSIILLLATLCFSIVYTMEIVVKNATIISAIKKAAKIGFRTENIIKTFCFLILMSLLAISVMLFASFLTTVVTFICSKLSITISDQVYGMLFSFLNLTIIWVPLKLTTFIYFYNDLDLRFENDYTGTTILRKFFEKKWFSVINS